MAWNTLSLAEDTRIQNDKTSRHVRETGIASLTRRPQPVVILRGQKKQYAENEGQRDTLLELPQRPVSCDDAPH